MTGNASQSEFGTLEGSLNGGRGGGGNCTGVHLRMVKESTPGAVVIAVDVLFTSNACIHSFAAGRQESAWHKPNFLSATHTDPL